MTTAEHTGQAVMDSVETYLADITAAIRPLPVRQLALADAFGAVLAADVTAEWLLPSFDNSAMDGYAVRACDVAGASEGTPVLLPVDGELAAGDTAPRELVPGTCIRIMTGAPMPAGSRRGGPGRADRRRHAAGRDPRTGRGRGVGPAGRG